MSCLEDYGIIPDEDKKLYRMKSSNISDPAKRREVKIAQFKKEKEMKNRISVSVTSQVGLQLTDGRHVRRCAPRDDNRKSTRATPSTSFSRSFLKFHQVMPTTCTMTQCEKRSSFFYGSNGNKLQSKWTALTRSLNCSSTPLQKKTELTLVVQPIKMIHGVWTCLREASVLVSKDH